jgi:hypothetical protein
MFGVENTQEQVTIQTMQEPTQHKQETQRSWGSEIGFNSSTGEVIPYEILYTKQYTMNGRGQTLPITSNDEAGIFTLKADTFEREFSNTEEVDVSLLIAGHMNATNAKKVIEIAAARQDCIAFVSAKPLEIVNEIGTTTTDDDVFDVLNTYRGVIGLILIWCYGWKCKISIRQIQ